MLANARFLTVFGLFLVWIGLATALAVAQEPNAPQANSKPSPAAANQAPTANNKAPANDLPPPVQQEAGPAPKIAAPQPFTAQDGKRKGWKVKIPGDHALATPAVVDGKLFIGGGFGSHEFYAFDPQTGKMLWQYRTADDGPTAAVAADGCVAFNTESCELEVVSRDGKPLWKKWLGDPLMSMPAISGGRLLMAFPDSRGDHEHHLACFDLKTGNELWRKALAGEIITAPVIDDEQVFLATLEGSLYCFHAKDGSLAWTEKEKNVTSAPTLWNGRCWFSRRQEATVTKAGKKVKQQMEQVATRETQAKSPIHDLATTQRVADYLDYSKRGGMRVMGAGMGGMMAPAPASPKEAASQNADKGVGFDGGGIGANEPPTQAAAPAKKPAVPQSQPSGPQTPPPAVQQAGGKGDAKILQAQMNLGQATVHGVWSYQGSKPFFYRGWLYAAMGDTLVCVDPKTEQVLWKTALRPPKVENKEKPAFKQKQEPDELLDEPEVLLDATISPPALANGKVFVGTSYGEVVCLSANQGAVLWKASLGPAESICFQPAVADGHVFVSTESGSLFGLETGDPQDDGWLMWGANASHNGIVQAERHGQ
jgi:outer membrane protein assembly factor BamB